ncbi:hypothetical protein C7R13_05525 [Staphylococcus aureus]|nr:hypothetical protein C7R13_05525 [Staphylococcus aureus]
MSTLGFIDINKAPFKVFIFSMSTLKGAFHYLSIRFSYKTKKATVMWLFVIFSIKMVSITVFDS